MAVTEGAVQPPEGFMQHCGSGMVLAPKYPGDVAEVMPGWHGLGGLCFHWAVDFHWAVESGACGNEVVGA